jgi:hypothetical protein
MSLEWNIRYDAWMIEDGLPDRSVGQEFSWDIEFWSPHGLANSAERRKTAIPVSDYRYLVVAHISSMGGEYCVIDFGLKVVGNISLLPAGCKTGDYVAGEIVLSLNDGCELPATEDSRELKKTWHVNAIQADLTPFVSHPENPRQFYRDESRIKYEPVWSTDAVKANSYILHCSEIF